MNWKQEWENPSMRARIKPFWFWNGDMNEEMIDMQLREMKKQGLGGAFICARQGQTISYLNQAWFDKVSFACERAKRYGLEVWLYDEYPYPSGMSGGEVLLEHPEAAHTQLTHKSYTLEGGKDEEIVFDWQKVLYAKAVHIKEDNKLDWSNTIDLSDFIGNRQDTEIYQKTGLTAYNNKRFFSYGPKKVLSCQLPKGKWKIEIYTQKYLDDFKYYGNYLDPCNKAAVYSFLETTHEKYAKALGDEFGKSIYGMFSDEVGMLGRLPWSTCLPEYFLKRNGYDIRNVLNAMHYSDVKDAYKIRYDFYQTIHELFRESYHKQVSNWCDNHHLLYATEVPSMRRSTQIYSHVPGGDTSHEKLGRSLDWVYDRYLASYRSCAQGVSSMARQMGRDFAMIESFHSVGWSMTLQDAKWMFDLLGAQGINLYNVHAFYYTIDSITKHDAPPSQFFQNPYWENYHLLADYAGRLSSWVSNTEAMHEVALLDPVATLWTHLGNPMQKFSYAGEDDSEKAQFGQLKSDWIHIAKTLFHAQIGFDFLDGEVMAMAEVTNGKLVIGKASYSVIVIPPNTAMECFVTEKLKAFIEDGGKVIGLGLLPCDVIDQDKNVVELYKDMFQVTNKIDSDYWKENDSFMKNPIIKENTVFIPTSGAVSKAGIEKTLAHVINGWIKPQVKVEVRKDVENELFSSIRMDVDGDLYVFVGNHGKTPVTALIEIQDHTYSFAGVMSLENGKKTKVEIASHKIGVSLGEYESQLYCITRKSLGQEWVETIDHSIVSIPATENMDVTIDRDNVFRIDTFDISLDNKTWKETEVKTFVELCDSLNLLSGEHLTYVGDFGTPKNISIHYPITAYFKASFHVKDLPNHIHLLMDKRAIKDRFMMDLNGYKITEKDFGPVFVNDQNNRLCDITPFIHLGENELHVTVVIEKDCDGICDPLYLLGDFGVIGNEIVSLPRKAKMDWKYIKGFPYFSGTFTFHKKWAVAKEGLFDTFQIELDGLKEFHDSLELKVNGHSLGIRAFAPYRFQCKKDWIKQENEVEIGWTNTLVNMLEGSYFDYEHHTTVKIK